MTFRNILVFLGILSFSFCDVAQAAPLPAMTRQGFIAQAQQSGQYSPEKALYYKLLSIYHPEKLPPELQQLPNAFQRSATPLFRELYLARKNNSFLDDDGEFNDVGNRPVSQGYIDSEKYPIRVHYTNARWQDLTSEVLELVEKSWTVEVDELGFWEPPQDFGVDGSDRFDVYIHDNAAGAYGYVAGETEFLDPEKGVSACTSFMVIDGSMFKDAFDYEEVPVTIAHELNHAMQNAYDCVESNAFYENTSTLIMNYVFPSIDQEVRLPYFQALPHSSLNAYYYDEYNVQYQYGGFLVPLFVDKYFGNGDGKLVAKIWEHSTQEDFNNSKSYFKAIDDIARQKNLTFDDFQALFTEWRYFLGEYDDHQHFGVYTWNDGKCEFDFSCDPTVALDQTVLIKQGYYYENLENSEKISLNSSSYIMIEMPKTKSSGILKLNFQPASVSNAQKNSGNRWFTQIFCQNKDLSNIIYPLPLDNDYRGSIELPNDNAISHCTLAITNLGLPDAQIAESNAMPNSKAEWKYSYKVEVEYVTSTMADPQITSVSANRLECSGKQNLTIKGTNFYKNMKITIGDKVITDITAFSKSFVDFVTPAMEESGHYDIKVYNVNGKPVSSIPVIYYGDSCSCGCNNSPACDSTCSCDPDCIICECDLDTACNPDCACDAECHTDVENGNDAGCSCDSRVNPEQNLNNFIGFLIIGLIGGLAHFRKKIM